MPFAYYGAKHGLADRYPPPVGGLIIEPFAGSAGYSCLHAPTVDRVILFDVDPAVIKLWGRMCMMTHAELDRIEAEVLEADRSSDPLILAPGGSTSLKAGLDGVSRQITPRMRDDWPKTRRRIERWMPHAHKFEIHHGAYTDAPDIEATWHIDPPYQPLILNDTRTHADQAGNAYRSGADQLGYTALAAWCRTRRGLVMVCEQSPAEWLPFAPLARQVNASGAGGSTRTELIWRNDAEQHALF